MASGTAESEQSREQPKSSSAPSWRDRLKDKANKLAKGNRPSQSQIDQDVHDFLRSSSSAAGASPGTNNSVQPGTSAGPASLPPEGALGAPVHAVYQMPVRKKVPRRRGLHVSFSDKEPDIIGEGGGECELPAKDVVGSWIPPEEHAETAGGALDYNESGGGPVKDYGDLISFGNAPSRRSVIQRAPTRHRSGAEWEFKRQSMAAEEALAQAQVARQLDDERKKAELATIDGHEAQAEVEGPSMLPPMKHQVQAQAEGSSMLPPIKHQASIKLPHSTELWSQADRHDPPAVHSSPASSVHDLEVPPVAHSQSFTEKPYLVTKAKENATSPERKPVRTQSETQGFVAYNPSYKRSVESVNQSSSQRPPVPPENFTAPRARDRSLERDVSYSPSSSHETLHSLHSPSTLSKVSSHNSASQFGQSSIHSLAPSLPQQSPFNDTPSDPRAEAAEDFYSRMQHMRGIFRLAAEKSRVRDKTASHWLRASAWWFCRGKMMLEAGLRMQNQDPDRPSSRGGENNLPTDKQCYVDLAKAFWIYDEMMPDLNDPHGNGSVLLDRIDGLKPLQVQQLVRSIKLDMQEFIYSLKKRDLLPPPALLVQGADPDIWIECASLPQGVLALTAGLDPRTFIRYVPPNMEPFFSLPISDTDKIFSYGRVFGEATVLSDSVPAEANRFVCIVSIVRPRSESHVEFLVCTQDGQINVRIQSDLNNGPTWDQVEWKVKAQTLGIRLSRDVALAVRLRENDFKTLWSIHDYNKRVEVDRAPRPDEELLYSDAVVALHYIRPQGVQLGFPTSPVRNCKMRLFQKNTVSDEGGNHRQIYCGYRLVAVTPSIFKTLSSMSIELGCTAPILYNNVKGENGAPALMVQAGPDRKTSVVISFATPKARSQFHAILAATATSPDESFSEEIPFSGMSTHLLDAQKTELGMPQGIQWQKLKVVNQGHSLEESRCILSDRLRVCLTSNYGTITDRINLGVGELSMGFDALDNTTISFYRPPQNSLTVSFLESLLPKGAISVLQETLKASANAPTYRFYKFPTIPALHHFQALVTGYSVVYDGRPCFFSINRRRMVLHKKLEATKVRIQVIQQVGMIQLLAFFEDFPQGKCMNFVLRGSDVFESYAKSGKFYVKFVDADFAMPKSEKDERWHMVCLDTVEYPNEHDDIVFGYEKEDERNAFASALPTTPKSSRTILRKKE